MFNNHGNIPSSVQMIGLSGRLVLPDGVEDKTIIINEGKIIDIFDGFDNDLDDVTDRFQGMIYPGLVDMHTHLGDNLARGALPSDLRQVVLPGGVKDRFLRNSSRSLKVKSIRRSIEEICKGVTSLLDFREGGIEGISILEEAAKGTLSDILVLARPEKRDDVPSLLERSSGLGLPSLDSCNAELREITQKAGKIFSFHASEMYREDIDRILDLHPDLLVHMISGTRDDWNELVNARIPVVVCPRSNFAYSLPLSLAVMNDSGLAIGLGTDNSLSVRQDMFREMEMAWLMLREFGMEGSEAAREVFSMAIGEKMKDTDLITKMGESIRWWEQGWPRKGDPSHLMVLDENRKMGSDPISDLVRFRGQNNVLFTGP